MDTVNNDVINFIQTIGCGDFGTTLFFGRVPSSNKIGTEAWLLTNTSVSNTKHNPTGEDTLVYTYEISYRNMNVKDVDAEIFRITKELTTSHCISLAHFKTVNIEFNAVSPMQIDTEGRMYASVSFRVTVYDVSNAS